MGEQPTRNLVPVVLPRRAVMVVFGRLREATVRRWVGEVGEVREVREVVVAVAGCHRVMVMPVPQLSSRPTGMALETTMPVTGSWPASADTRRLVGVPMSRTFSSVSERAAPRVRHRDHTALDVVGRLDHADGSTPGAN